MEYGSSDVTFKDLTHESMHDRLKKKIKGFSKYSKNIQMILTLLQIFKYEHNTQMHAHKYIKSHEDPPGGVGICLCENIEIEPRAKSAPDSVESY